jgi:hypothetical protein
MRTSQITTVFEGVPSVFLSLPIVPWVARPAFLPVTLTNTDHKHSDTRHPASITASATYRPSALSPQTPSAPAKTIHVFVP